MCSPAAAYHRASSFPFSAIASCYSVQIRLPLPDAPDISTSNTALSSTNFFIHPHHKPIPLQSRIPRLCHTSLKPTIQFISVLLFSNQHRSKLSLHAVKHHLLLSPHPKVSLLFTIVFLHLLHQPVYCLFHCIFVHFLPLL